MGFKAISMAIAAVALFASAAVASATDVNDAVSRSSYYRGLGASCNRYQPCSAGNLVCVGGKCVAKYVPAGKPCGGPVLCYRGASCDAGKCIAYVAAGKPCGGTTNAKCYANASCNSGKCVKYVPAGQPCGRYTNAQCYGDASCDGGKCIRWVGAGSPCGGATAAKCYTNLQCSKGKCRAYYY